MRVWTTSRSRLCISQLRQNPMTAKQEKPTGSWDTEQPIEPQVRKPKKKRFRYVLGVVVVLWLGLFLSNTWVLVWENVYDNPNSNPFKCSEGTDICSSLWVCKYFNGRRVIEKQFTYESFSKYPNKNYKPYSCPSFL